MGFQSKKSEWLHALNPEKPMMMCNLGASKFWCSSQSILLAFFNMFNSKLKSKAPWEVFNDFVTHCIYWRLNTARLVLLLSMTH